ncbi:MAG TPA: HEAT repeat domain-containing protein [Spirochaetota bacterium]|nr:HEAT repeat domain-containing protein [Spirochaetota bacterium]
MPLKTVFIYLSFTIFFTLTIVFSASAQTETINEKKNIPQKKTVSSGEDKNKSFVKEVPTKEPEDAKKEIIPLTDDKSKSQSKDQKNTESNTAKKGSDPQKDTKGAEVWDDTKKAEKIESTLEYGMQKDRKIAITMINDIKDEQIKNKLIQKLVLILENDSDMEVRKAAITAIGDHKYISSTPALIKALDDSSEDIKIAACYALGRIKADSARPKLVELFRKQDLKADSNFTDALITTLGDLKAPDILDIAVTAEKDAAISKMIRERLIIYIGYTGSAAQKDFLVELYKNDDEDMMIRSYAIKSISKLKIKEATEDIKTIIKEIDSYPFNKKKKYYDLYMFSVAALVEMGDTDSISLLMNSLRSDNTSVRLRALNLIKEFNDERTIDILKYKMKNDPSGKVRKAAKKALEDKGLIEKGKGNEDSKNEYEKEEKDE